MKDDDGQSPHDICHMLATTVLLWTSRHVCVGFRNGNYFIEDGLPIDVHLTPQPTPDKARLEWCHELTQAGLIERNLF